MLKVKNLEITLIVLYDESGLEGVKNGILEEEILELRPDYHEFVSPNTYYIVLKKNVRNAARLPAFLEKLRRLSAEDERFHELRVGKKEGLCPCSIGSMGKIVSIPLGDIAYHAMREAVASTV